MEGGKAKVISQERVRETDVCSETNILADIKASGGGGIETSFSSSAIRIGPRVAIAI